MPTVVLVRPGCTDFDDQCRIQGVLDLPLNERGEAQLADIVQQVAEVPVEVVYTSSCEPARSTAEEIAVRLDISLKESENLKNLNQGLWQGLPVDEVRRKYPKVFKQWRESPETICPPEGETVTAAIERVQRFLEKPLRKKDAFAIVASEPLATLISCALRGRRPEFDNSAAPGSAAPRIEVIETNGAQQSNGVPQPDILLETAEPAAVAVARAEQWSHRK